MSVRGHLRSLEMAPFDKSRTSSYWRSIVITALSGIISEIKQDISRKSRFLTSSAYDAPARGFAVGILP